MTTLLVSLPYARFDSDWFALVPNINLGTAEGCLTREGHGARSFHVHLEFLPFLQEESPATVDNLRKLASLGIEYCSIDFLAATLLPGNAARADGPRRERLERLGLGVDDLPGMGRILERFLDRCLARLLPHLPGARVVAFSCSHGQLCLSLLLARMVKERQPGAAVIIGGKDVAGDSGRLVLSRFPWVDHVAFGECESTLLPFAAGIRDAAGLPPGMLSRGRKGRAARGAARPGIDLDAAALPAYPLADFPIPPERLIMPLELGRGCSWGKCSFCPDRAYGIAARTKSAARVAAEIRHLLDRHPALTRHIILDADALKSPDLIHDLAPLVAGLDLTIVFAELRAERLTRAALADFLRLGRWGSPFQVGIESFSGRLLERMNKGVDPLTNVAAVKAAAELGAPLQFNIITSFPRLSRSEFEENLAVMERIRHLLAVPTTHLFPSEFYLPPDCEIHQRADHYRIRHTRESTFSGFFPGSELHDLGNYPRYLAFDNHQEQMRLSTLLREWIEKLGREKPGALSLAWRDDGTTLTIERRNGNNRRTWILDGPRRLLLLAAEEGVRPVGEAATGAGIPPDEVAGHLAWLHDEGLVLYDAASGRYLSLPTAEPDHVGRREESRCR